MQLSLIPEIVPAIAQPKSTGNQLALNLYKPEPVATGLTDEQKENVLNSVLSHLILTKPSSYFVVAK
jgi:hypothetical protein